MSKSYDTGKFNAMLRKFIPVLKRELAAVEVKNADEFVQTARRIAPKDPVDGTPLHDSIRRHPTGTGGQFVRAGGPTTMKTSKSGGPYDYAVGQEFGNSEVPRQAYFWPSYRLLRKKFVGRRKAALRKAIKEVSNG